MHKVKGPTHAGMRFTGEYECRIHPPTRVPTGRHFNGEMVGIGVQHGWPLVEKNDWCGSFEAR